MHPLVTHDGYGYTKLYYDILIKESNYAKGGVIRDYPSLCPLCQILHGHHYILALTYGAHLQWSDKVEAPSLKLMWLLWE